MLFTACVVLSYNGHPSDVCLIISLKCCCLNLLSTFTYVNVISVLLPVEMYVTNSNGILLLTGCH